MIAKPCVPQLILAGLCLAAAAGNATAGDWPQILGPQRDGIAAADESIGTDWGSGGPPVLWQRPVGQGFAGAAVAQGRVVVFHRQEDQEIAECLDAATGKRLWSAEFPCGYVPTISYDGGPRCVPTIVGDTVLLYGPQGSLHAVSLSTGKEQWTVETHQLYKADEGYFGAGSSPLVVGDRVIVNVGGDRANAGVVAFSLKDGTELWKATANAASYSSPVAAEVNGTTHVIVVTRLETVSLDPATGAVRFRFPYGKRGPTVNAANPLILPDGHLFLTASYGIGAVFGRIGAASFTADWTSDDVLSSQYTTCVRDGRFLYGVHGRQDVGQPVLRCFDPAAQKVVWEAPLPAYATLIKADGKLLITTVSGELIVAAADAAKYRELARAKVQEPTPRASALPALSDGRLFVRDGETLRCLNLRK